MIDNPTLRVIRERRSIRNFTSESVSADQIATILDAARWAPSGLNSQPWDLVVVEDPEMRSSLGAILKRVTFSWAGMANAAVMIVVSVDETRDPDHFVEDGAVAAQNLCLAAQSLGLASSWAGVYAPRNHRKSVERSIADLVGLPGTHRVIAVVPVGHGRLVKEPQRRPLTEMVHHDRYQPLPDSRPQWDGQDDEDPSNPAALLAEPRRLN